MQALFELELDVIDHRSWHSRFESTVINEVYVKGMVKKDMEVVTQLEIIMQKVKDSIKQDVSSTSADRVLIAPYRHYQRLTHLLFSM